MPKKFQWDVFVSHNRRQKPWVREAVAQWRECGLRVFFDEDSLDPGEPSVRGLERGLARSRHIVFLITPAALASKWIALETALAIYEDPDARDRKLVPVLLKPTRLKEIPLSIRSLTMVDLTDSRQLDDQYHRLLRFLGVPDASRVTPPPLRARRAAQPAAGDPARKASGTKRPLPDSGRRAPARRIVLELELRTVLELDLTGYTAVVRELEENLGPEAVARVNDEIQGFVDQGLRKVRLPRESTVVKTTGDGAILIFAKAAQAHRFAEEVHRAADLHNRTKTVPTARRCFRMGASTGRIAVQDGREIGLDIAGTRIADAVRLEAAAKPGQFLADHATYEALPPDMQARYGERPVKVRDKHGRTYNAWRCVMSEACGKSARTAASTVSSAECKKKEKALLDLHASSGIKALIIIELMIDRLAEPPYLLDRLMIFIAMPRAAQPPNVLPHGERCTKVFNWSAAQGKAGVEKLKAGIEYLLKKNSQ